jgi:hypothetical protein
MATYSNPSALHRRQPLLPGPRQARAAPRDPVVSQPACAEVEALD